MFNFKGYSSQNTKLDILSPSCRNVPKIIEVLSTDGSSGQHIEASKVDISSGLFSLLFLTHWSQYFQLSLHITCFRFSLPDKSWVSPTQRYAVVPNENVSLLYHHTASTLGELLKKLSSMKVSDSTSMQVQMQSEPPVGLNGNDASVPENDVKRIRIW